MKHFLLVLVVLLNSFFLNSQFARVDHVHAVKATVLGLSYSYERSIGNESVINIEGMVAGRFGSNIFLGEYWVIAPVLRVEPRYYYNYLKRKEYGKKILHNAANYLSLSYDYQFGVSIGKNAHAISNLTVMPKWGLKRTIGNNFIFELAGGVGALKQERENWKGAIGLDLRFGFAF